jgi:integrase
MLRMARLSAVAGDESALGGHDPKVQAILRHSDVGVTQQAYIKAANKVKAEGMAKLQAALAAAKKKARKA